MKRVAILFSNLGPYHVARLDAAGARLAGDGMAVAGLEVAASQREYPWTAVAGQRRFERITLCPGAPYESWSRAQVHAAVHRALDACAPQAVALPGWSLPEARAGLSWCRAHGVGAILMSESSRHDEPRVAWREWVKRQVVSAFDAAVVGGRTHAQYAAALGLDPARIWLGYDAVDNAHFEAGARDARARQEEVRLRLHLPARYFLASARFIAKKNLARLLDAFASYRWQTSSPAWDLVLCGDGDQRAALESQAATLGMHEHVRFPGFVSYDDLPAYYGLASAFVHASTTEQWGLVVNEAMAAGLPVLVSDRCGCAPELVQVGRNGFTFDPADTAELAARMTALAGPACDRDAMGQASAAIVNDWSPVRFGDALAQAVACVTAGPRRRLSPASRAVLAVFT